MKVFGYKLSTWILHPKKVWDAFQRQKLPVVDFDFPDNNCRCCGHAHKYADKKRCLCFCCRFGSCKGHPCCFDNLNRKKYDSDFDI